MLNHKQTKKLANEMVSWYFNNNIQDNINNLFKKDSNKNPKHSEEVWAKLMLDAISSFYEGMEGYALNTRCSDKILFDNAVNLVGAESFNTITTIVAAAGTQYQPETNLIDDTMLLDRVLGI